MLIVKCPQCFKNQKTEPLRIDKARKRCVFCGKSFYVRERVVSKE